MRTITAAARLQGDAQYMARCLLNRSRKQEAEPILGLAALSIKEKWS
jgi:hypothetical protein